MGSLQRTELRQLRRRRWKIEELGVTTVVSFLLSLESLAVVVLLLRLVVVFSQMLYSILLPTYNGRENLPIMFFLLHKYLTAANKMTFEVVVVDDDD